MILSERLRAIISMVPRNKCTADVGTDHGFVPVSLISEGIAERAIASDVGKGPLSRAEEHVRALGLEDRIECRLGDGLSVLSPGEAEVIVIAGMGGMLIVRILLDGREVLDSTKTLILSPHRDALELRRSLEDLGFTITDERMVREEGKYYPVIRAEKAKTAVPRLSETELRFGPVLLWKRPEAFLQYLKELESKTEEEIGHLQAQEASKSVSDALREKTKALSEIRKTLSMKSAKKGLRIRKMKEEDREDLYVLLSDPEVMRYLEEPYDRTKTEAFLKNAGLSEPPRVYAAEEGGRFIGYVIFHAFDAGSMEIGWVLRKDRWGRGIASRLAEMLIEKGLSLGKDLVIECDPEQGATRRIALKNGFAYCGREGRLDIYRLRRPQT